MIFGHPRVFWTTLAILPLLALFFWATWRKRQALIRSFVQNKNLAQLTLGTSTARQKVRRVLLFAAVATLLFTMARPQWGFTWEEASQRGRDIIVAIDTSRSMLAEDLQPNRLTRAKLAALDLLKLGKFDRFGLVAFSGTAFLQCPLTFDDEAFRQSVQILEPGIIPQGGTALGEAIDAARRAFSEDADQNHRVLVLFTDGENHEEGALETARSAAREGMKIFTVGVGTPGGELLRVRDERGNLNYVKDDAGNVVKSRLNESLLQEIATTTGGFYLQLQGANTMEVLFQKGLAPLPTSERSSRLLKRYKEQFYWPLAFAILLLVMEVFIPEQKRAPRKAEVAKQRSPNGVVAALLLFFVMPDVRADANKAARLYNKGKYEMALDEYERLIRESPNNAELHYNAGASAFQIKQFDLAIESFETATRSRNLDLQEMAFYNLGNSYYYLGERSRVDNEKMAAWKKAVQNYEAALNINPRDEDAKTNHTIVKAKLDELLEKQQQQEQKNNQDKRDEEKKEQGEEKEQQQDNQSDQEQKQEQNKPGEDKQKEQQQQQPGDQQREQEQQQNQQQENQQNQKEQQNRETEEAQRNNQSQPQQSGDKESDQQPPESEGQGEAAQLGRMTPAQAKQLLDAQKSEEKALIFIPPQTSKSREHIFKDW